MDKGRGVQLRTARLLLRPFQAGDVEDALEYRNDEEFARFLPHIPQPFTRRDAEEFVTTNMTEEWERFPTFAVVLAGKVIGTVNLEIDAPSRSAMLGYAIGRKHWGLGIGVEASRAIVDWAFGTFDLVRVWASTDARHLRSQRVLDKLGMHREQVLRGHHRGRDSLPTDEVVYAVSAEEWSASQQHYT
jgi:ribosomal-protein-alanine N-acetyltransferase